MGHKVKSFNSRTPGGVRRFVRAFLLRLDEVSIHAPREGCDVNAPHSPILELSFQFTHPGRGATYTHNGLTVSLSVSIHAPREGCDANDMVCSPTHTSFNSRTPGGVRHRLERFLPAGYAFQFTHPGRGATNVASAFDGAGAEFQFTHPGRGATGLYFLYRQNEQSFNSRTPGGVRPQSGSPTAPVGVVSIHAPREGCDGKDAIKGDFSKFQFTHPGRGATVVQILRYIKR